MYTSKHSIQFANATSMWQMFLVSIYSSICCVYNHDPTGPSACPVSNQTCPHPKNDKNRFLRRVLPAKDLLPHQQTMFIAKIQKTLVLCIMCLDENGWKIANENGVDPHNFRPFFCFSFCQLVTFCSNRGISVHEFPTVTVLELGGSQQNSAITKSQQLWTTSHPFN